MACCNLELTSETINLVVMWYDSLDGETALRKASTYTGQHNRENCGHTSVHNVGFEPTIPLFEWSKTVHVLDHSVFSMIKIQQLKPSNGKIAVSCLYCRYRPAKYIRVH